MKKSKLIPMFLFCIILLFITPITWADDLSGNLNGIYCTSGSFYTQNPTTVPSGNTAKLSAGIQIVLAPEFYAQSGSSFLATIGDCDFDGMPDAWEDSFFCVSSSTDDANVDFDQDGPTNIEEYYYGTDPCDPDTDDDGMPDGWEIDNGFDPNDDADASEDADGDGIPNWLEYQVGTNPHDPGSKPTKGTYYQYDALGRIKSIVRLN
jgi:hypothetical protein